MIRRISVSAIGEYASYSSAAMTAAVFLTAHHAAKFHPRASARTGRRRRQMLRDGRVRELDFDFHAHSVQPPDTGGIKATSSASVKRASRPTYSEFFASRTEAAKALQSRMRFDEFAARGRRCPCRRRAGSSRRTA